MSLLKQLGKLRDSGVVTNEEVEAKKKDLLARLQTLCHRLHRAPAGPRD